jgi:hypothetical protein
MSRGWCAALLLLQAAACGTTVLDQEASGGGSGDGGSGGSSATTTTTSGVTGPCADYAGDLTDACRSWLIDVCRSLSLSECKQHPRYGDLEVSSVVGCSAVTLLAEETGCSQLGPPHRCAAGIDHGDMGPLPGWEGDEVLLFVEEDPNESFTPHYLMSGTCSPGEGPATCACNGD